MDQPQSRAGGVAPEGPVSEIQSRPRGGEGSDRCDAAKGRRAAGTWGGACRRAREAAAARSQVAAAGPL